MAEHGISETVSKKKRGRPPLMNAEQIGVYQALWPEITTGRSHHNHAYLGRATSLLRPGGAPVKSVHAWFAGEGPDYRQAILVELGRIAFKFGDAVMLQIADQISEAWGRGDVPTTREVAAWLRRRRLGALKQTRAPNRSALAKRLLTTVLEYYAEHPTIDAQFVFDALQLAGNDAEAALMRLQG